jgi:hypothetical protein
MGGRAASWAVSRSGVEGNMSGLGRTDRLISRENWAAGSISALAEGQPAVGASWAIAAAGSRWPSLSWRFSHCGISHREVGKREANGTAHERFHDLSQGWPQVMPVHQCRTRRRPFVPILHSILGELAQE